MRRYMRYPVYPLETDSEVLEWPRDDTRGLTVFVREDERPVRTGLFDADGVELFAVTERLPAGFVRF